MRARARVGGAGRLDGVEVEQGNAFDQYINLRNEVHCRTCKGHLVRRARACVCARAHVLCGWGVSPYKRRPC